VIVSGYAKALVKTLEVLRQISRTIDIEDKKELKELVMSAIGTKFSSRWGEQMVNMAITAVLKVVNRRGEYTEVDVKRYVRIEKIPGGELSECAVIDGVMFNKDVTHSKMRRRIESPRILLLDCPLEYKKGESTTNVELTTEDDFNALLKQEEEHIEQMCAQVPLPPPPLINHLNALPPLSFTPSPLIISDCGL
jgi:T-complex protein 1 subunit gamma